MALNFDSPSESVQEAAHYDKQLLIKVSDLADDEQDNARDTTASDMEESKYEVGTNPFYVKRQ